MEIRFVKNKLRASGLADLLITLVVISVIMSLTMPTLVTSSRKKVYTAQLKKSYDSISMAFQAVMKQQNTKKLSYTTLFDIFFVPPTIKRLQETPFGYIVVTEYDQTKKLKGVNSIVETLSANSSYRTAFERVFKVVQIYGKDSLPVEDHILKYTSLTDDDFTKHNTAILLVDGTCIIDIHTGTSYRRRKARDKTKLWDAIGEIAIDVNCFKKPNKLGRDLFYFFVGNNGVLYPFGGEDYALYNNCTREQISNEECSYYWKNKENSPDSCNKKDSIGRGCAARIIEEGWKMNY